MVCGLDTAPWAPDLLSSPLDAYWHCFRKALGSPWMWHHLLKTFHGGCQTYGKKLWGGKKGGTDSLPMKYFYFTYVLSNIISGNHRNTRTTSGMSELIICWLYICQINGKIFLKSPYMCAHLYCHHQSPWNPEIRGISPCSAQVKLCFMAITPDTQATS